MLPYKLSYKVFSFLILFSVYGVKSQNTPDRTFLIKIIEKGQGTSEGELYLKNNTISATFSLKNNFPPAVYTFVQDSTTLRNVQAFTAECTNSKKHTLKWTGMISGLTIQGKAQHFYFGAPAGEYIFTGTLKK